MNQNSLPTYHFWDRKNNPEAHLHYWKKTHEKPFLVTSVHAGLVAALHAIPWKQGELHDQIPESFTDVSRASINTGKFSEISASIWKTTFHQEVDFTCLAFSNKTLECERNKWFFACSVNGGYRVYLEQSNGYRIVSEFKIEHLVNEVIRPSLGTIVLLSVSFSIRFWGLNDIIMPL